MAPEMEKCRWLRLRLVATIEYLEWTAANQLRHSSSRGCPHARDNYWIRKSFTGNRRWLRE
jgi:hypothetical protein